MKCSSYGDCQRVTAMESKSLTKMMQWENFKKVIIEIKVSTCCSVSSQWGCFYSIECQFQLLKQWDIEAMPIQRQIAFLREFKQTQIAILKVISWHWEGKTVNLQVWRLNTENQRFLTNVELELNKNKTSSLQ